jgi:trimeric autotransporter adhesin
VAHQTSTRSERLLVRCASLALAPVLLFGAIALSPAAQATSLNVSFTASSINYGSVTVGTSAAGQVVVTNTSTFPIYLQSDLIHGGASGEFVASPSACAGAVAVGASCDINVTFTPSVAGDRTSNVSVVMGAKDKAGKFVATSLVQVGLNGQGVAPTFTLSNGDAGTVAVKSTGIANATLTNTSSVPLSVKSWSIQGDVHHEFTVSAVTCPTPVAPGSSCNFVVVYAPNAPGAVAATLSVTMNVVGTSPARTVSESATVSGTGVKVNGKQPFVVLSSLDFGTVTVGTSASGELAVVNTSAKNATIKKFIIGGTDDKEFTLGTNNCTAPLKPNTSCTAVVNFTPAFAKIRSATVSVVVTHWYKGNLVTSVVQTSLTGTGVKPTVSLSAPDFGSVTIGSSTSNDVTVTNNSLAPLTLSKTSLAGPHLPSWKVSGTTCAGSLAPSASCEVELTFAPHTAGNLDVQLNTLFTIKVGKRVVSVVGQATIDGTGVQPTFTVVPSALGPTDQSVAATGTAVITNTSDVALNFQGAHLVGTLAGDFTVTGNTCSAQLAPTGTCDLNLTFDPTQVGAGTRTAFLTTTMVVDGITPTHTVSLAVAVSGDES